MAAKLIALYNHPDNTEAFEQAYFETHVPLAKKMPGLKGIEVIKPAKNVMGGELPYYMIAELLFDSMDALKAALSSPEGQAAGANLMGFAAGKFTLLMADVVPAKDGALV